MDRIHLDDSGVGKSTLNNLIVTFETSKEASSSTELLWWLINDFYF